MVIEREKKTRAQQQTANLSHHLRLERFTNQNKDISKKMRLLVAGWNSRFLPRRPKIASVLSEILILPKFTRIPKLLKTFNWFAQMHLG